MNYVKHYNLLIDRARNRTLSYYTERHHIIPRCMGGDNRTSNIVKLTAEEHYVAHLLLIKIYPNNNSLIYAASMMTVSSCDNKRNNKRYGWLRKKYQLACKTRIGNKNPSFGKLWYYDPKTFESGKFIKDRAPNNWIRGRNPKVSKQETYCEVCQQLTGGYRARFCKVHRLEHKKKYAHKSGETLRKRKTAEDAAKFIYAITTSKTWTEAIKKAGFKTDGYSRTRLQEFSKKYNITLTVD